MRELIKMVIVLTILSAASGGLLAAIKNGTVEDIEYQQLKFLKAPAVKEIFEGVENDPITDKIKIKDGEKEITFFPGVFGGEKNSVCFETFGKGYGGDLGLMVGVNLENDTIVGVRVTTHSETPGLGARAKDAPDLVEQFPNLPIASTFNVKGAGGQVDALTGATITSAAVCSAATDAGKLYTKLKDQIKASVSK
jgi:H+/Na+-translocating ferredoxin:NAD+ oxidoreductase subunit G